jgi:hypothetical protein
MEKHEERALQKIQIETTRVLRQVEELSAAIANANEAREQAMQRSIPAGHLHSLLWEAQVAVEQKKTLLHHLQNLEQERDQQMKVYQAAHRNREMLTDMFNKQRDVYEQERDRSQQKHLDDIFIARRHLHSATPPNLENN